MEYIGSNEGLTKGLYWKRKAFMNLEVDEVRHLDNLDGNQCQQSEDKSTKTLMDQFKRR